MLPNLKKLLPLCLCASVLCTTPAMAATKDDLNTSLEKIQITQQEKAAESESLQEELESITKSRKDISVVIIDAKARELKAKIDAKDDIVNKTGVAVDSVSDRIVDKREILPLTTAYAASIATEGNILSAENKNNSTEELLKQANKLKHKEAKIQEKADSVEAEIADLEEQEEQINSEIKEIEEAEKKAAEEAKRKEAEEASASSGERVYTQSSGGALTKSKGVVYYNGHKETYYSQRVLPGNGLNIPGRHVADDGTIRDEDGYICVAANPSYMSKGSIVETSLGTAKVYDSGCDYGTIDIYTDW